MVIWWFQIFCLPLSKLKNKTMNKHQSEINTIIKTISQLESLKQKLEFEGSFLKSLIQAGRGTWVIFKGLKGANTYYQFSHFDGKLNRVYLERHGTKHVANALEFESDFRLATPIEVQQHETYLASTGKPKMSLDVPDASTKKIYRLKPKYKGNEEALAVLAGVTSFPTTFEEGSHIETKLRASGVINWFEVEQTSVSAPRTIDPFKCEFYMVTCRGINGSKVRHATYDDAIKEAKRIAKREDHPAWVVGVIAKINP